VETLEHCTLVSKTSQEGMISSHEKEKGEGT